MTPPPESSDEYSLQDPDPVSSPLSEHSFIEAAFNALPTQVAILDDTGEIVYTNDAWRRFGESNGIAEPAHTLGVDYLEVCEESDDQHAATAAAGINAVLGGTQSQFSFEYPCHSDDERRWFTMRAIQFEHDGAEYVLVLHLNITDRKRSELRVQEQNTELETLNQVNSIVRNVIDSLLAGVTKTDIETAICEQLATSSLFHSAYIVDRSLDDRGFSVRASAGFSEETERTLADLENADCSGTGLETAIDEGSTEAVNGLFEAGSIPGPVADVARHHGYESHLIVPICYRRTTYGALVVNAIDFHAFSDREQSAFDVLGDAIGYAYNAIENRQLLHADAVTELRFEVSEPDSLLATISDQTECTVVLDGVVPAGDGTLRCYVTITETPPETVLESIDGLDGITAHVVSERTDDFLLECTIRAGSPLVPLVEYGATVEAARAQDGTLELSAAVAAGSEVRSVVEAVLSNRPTARLRSKQRTERSIRSTREFRAALDDRLTDRQRDMLEAAYFAGYFERPRETTGGEIADSFDISPPTFHQHLQTGLNKLAGLALDQDQGE
ncbi:hypothetical protein CV102_01435 [Natronococcus pandeyae]|uniref:Uncharacterized protein n=1 Tax=Natronococcus pandeyae TaxID=2055836 RepID=A0A8J8TTH9_9EURY|nr:bacterio-opsin activator domain-containing protein [Natronococcus pandeyae]TYL40270.1 hypothetical protein CV102_01435 [Natronococcus pandeyae]